MRIAFAGTPEFARVALERIAQAGHEVVLVLTQPDRRAGRGMKLQASPVKQFASARGMRVLQPHSLRLDGRYGEEADAALRALEAAQPDVMVVAAYGLMLPQWTLALPRLGCLNIHASLLPRWRGAAPIHRAIEAGDPETGVTIMQMDAGLDTGAMLKVERLAIGDEDTTSTLHDKLADLGASAVVRALESLAGEGLPARPQPEEGVTYAHKIEKQEAEIDWTQPVRQIERRIRAFDPFPGASIQVGADSIKVWRAHIVADALPAGTVPGQVLAVGPDGVDVAARDGVLKLTVLQRAGAKRLAVDEFLRGFPIEPGQRLVGSAS
ncbi:MAG: methionyl-tRNA formyltransferase [Hylemonella sp.]|nr:methionyl-tRNA formyltransferase [Hylemonella sp.]